MRTLVTALLLLAGVPLLATPATLVYIPSTDVQAAGTWHLGADSYLFTDSQETAKAFVDWGLTYGVVPRVEVGIDLASGTESPVWLNGKVQFLSPEKSPVALAAGVCNYSTVDRANQRMVYVVASATVSGTRLTFGGYTGNEKVLVPDHAGLLLGVDRTVGKWWLGADYQGGQNALGSWNVGVAYALTDRISFIVGYDRYHDPAAVGAKGSLNFQLDVNL
jgi:hypothetical protein